jgi:Domain of unknown function (DUF4864)
MMINFCSKQVARLLILLSLCGLAALPVAAGTDDVKIKSVIETQLDALARDDGVEAYAQAAPLVQKVFPTVDTFMTMVKKGYQPVYRNTARTFGQVFQDGLGRPAMRVLLTGADGKRYEAIYAMQLQEDGSWKIAGCVILAITAQEV